MKQVVQRLKDGRIEVLDVPPPALRGSGVLVDVRSSLLSAGTERSKIATGRQSLIGKARSRPDQVRQVLEKAERDGLRDTVAAVRTRLEQPEALGYSAAGVVLAIGARVRDLAVGDRIACAGAGYASHADVDYVPGNLCVRLPDAVGFDDGAFTTVGAVAMQGVRQADVRLGERVALVGLGLVGQLTGQLLKAAGCHVTGIDLSDELIGVALDTGAIDRGMTRSRITEANIAEIGGCDAVVITAATHSDDPVELAADLCRDRGRVVVVGDVGMRIPRPPYYEKELELRLSRSYGPGRYDREYEERGLDYPLGYVRWTERRNMTAFLDLVASGQVDVSALVRDRVPVDEAPRAYDRLLAGGASSLGLLIQYGESEVEDPAARSGDASAQRTSASPAGEPASPLRAGVIGAGSFASRVTIPCLTAAGFELEAVASATGLSAHSAAQRFDFGRADTPDGILDDPGIGLVAVVTRHSSHAELAERALRLSKAVFVEKPPCLTEEELDRLRVARERAARPLVVGFNRRHAPLVRLLRDHLAERDHPLGLLLRVNAGALDPEHWLNDPHDGGGRLLGEGCHFIDLACWLIGSLPQTVACSASVPSNGPVATAQRFSAALSFADGSIATILYGEGGARRLGKELIEAHWGGRSAVLDDFRTLTVFGGRRRRRFRRRRQDKGHAAQAVALRALLEGRHCDAFALDPLESMGVTLSALRSAEAGGAVIGTAIDRVE